MNSEWMAAWEGRLRPWLVRLPPFFAVRLYSLGRKQFLRSLQAHPASPISAVEGLRRTLWGLQFRSPLMNAAGMFKQGEGYVLAARQGAGAYLAGTTTGRPREGNRRAGITQPFAPYPSSGAASNWLGLPNPGHRVVASRLAAEVKVEGCPLGVSVTATPGEEIEEERKLAALVAGLRLYEEAGVDFIEMNESCPNTEDAANRSGFEARLAFVAEHFLAQRQRLIPVVVKLSCDTPSIQVPQLLRILSRLHFDGVNFGNTSTAYRRHREAIAEPERALYDYFSKTFGGGVSGRPLQTTSLELARAAKKHLAAEPADQEFHVIRTGGVEGAEDLRASEAAGVALNQWYSGYFEAFARHGHRLYAEIHTDLADPSGPQLKS